MLQASLWLAGTVVVVLIAVMGIFSYLSNGMCRNEIIADYPSPGVTHRIIVFQRDCGATTGYSTQASILDIGEALDDEAGNFLVADANHGAAPAGPGGGPTVSVVWEDDRSVLISLDPRARIFKNEPRLDGIRITYHRDIQPRIRIARPSGAGPGEKELGRN